MEATDTIDRLFIMVWTDEIATVRECGFGLDDANYRILVNNPLYSAGLAKMIGGLRLNGLFEVEVGGKTLHAPSFDRFWSVYVVGVDVSQLDTDSLVSVGDMFSSSFYPADMVGYTYPHPIPPSAIVSEQEIDLASPDVPMAP